MGRWKTTVTIELDLSPKQAGLIANPVIWLAAASLDCSSITL
jgi:hypothetical protein